VDAGSREHARLWIISNVLSAAANAVAGLIVLVLSRMLSVGDPDSGTLTTTIFLSLTGLFTALGLALFGFLTGRVLRRKLPAFPMRSWVAFHGVLGLVLGPIASFPLTMPEESDSEPLTADMTALLAIAAIIVGVILGAAMGSAQALILRKAARGLGAWIGYSALAGMCLLAGVPVVAYGPQTGRASELTVEAAIFFVSVMVGFVLLPAMLRLRPR
jgi:MFS family permease